MQTDTLSMIQAAAQFVVDVNKIYLPSEVLPGTEKEVEKDIRRQCKPIGFKFSKFPRSGGKCRYRLTDLESGLFFSHTDLRWMLAVMEAAGKEDSAEKASKPPQEKKVEIFDPFDL